MRPKSLAIPLLWLSVVACRRSSESSPPSDTAGVSEHSLSGGSFLTDPTDIRFQEQIKECDEEIEKLEVALAQRRDLAQFIETAEKAKPEGKELPDEAQAFLDERNAMRSRIKDIEARRRDLIKQAEEWRRRTAN
ncbi:hypothetical protein [Luteolibacter marinus]|uniref:hypothetical protein n=1 Tax=Luteolibacter marinus TaxID=2776705 RepID=UPI001D015B6F|nr:hypothetical protein [Luteolibacter marinus]